MGDVFPILSCQLLQLRLAASVIGSDGLVMDLVLFLQRNAGCFPQLFLVRLASMSLS